MYNNIGDNMNDYISDYIDYLNLVRRLSKETSKNYNYDLNKFNEYLKTENIKNPKIILPQVYDEISHVWHVFAIRTENRDEFQKYLESKGIQTLIHYPTPPHKQGAYKEWENKSYPISEEIHRTILSLPISPVLTDEEVQKVVEVINEY